MNLYFSHNHYEFTFSFAYSPSIHYYFRKIIINSLSASRFYYEYTYCFAKILWIYYLLRDFSLNSVLISRIHYLSREFTLKLNSSTKSLIDSLSSSPSSSRLSSSRHLLRDYLLHHLLRDFTRNSLFFTNSLHLKSLSVSRIHLESIFPPNHYEFTICYELSICYEFTFTINSLSFHANSLSVSRVHFESTIFFGKPLWFRYEITMKWFCNHYKNYYLLSDWIHFLFANSPIVSPTSYELTICFSISFWIQHPFPRTHYLFRE